MTVLDETRGVAAYRSVLRLPGVAPLSAVSFLARIPASAAGITLTLHVVLTLDLGYAAAGLVGAASTVGMAVGAPLLGRLVDRRGLRTALAVCLVVETAFWALAPWLPYPVLLAAAFVGGLLAPPVYSVVRQALAALVPPARRRPAFALDSMSTELSYIIGPAAGTGLVLLLSSPVALYAVGAGNVLAGIALWVLDPPTRVPAASLRSSHSRTGGGGGSSVAAALLATTASVLVVFGTELSMIAGLETRGEAAFIPVVNAVWCLASLAGGFLYGAARRSVPLLALVAGLGAASLPVALGGVWWSWALLLVPAGLLCAPSLAAASETVARLAPEHVRGLVTGLHGSAVTLGAAIGTPLAGAIVDAASPGTAVLVVGLTCVAAAGVAALLARPRAA